VSIPIKKQHGFTLIELVMVMVLLGIVTAVVAPRFSGTDTFSVHVVRDQILSAFRYAQQHAMYDQSGNCYSLIIDSSGFGPQRGVGTFIGPVGQVMFDDYQDISATEQTIYFDGLGNALSGSCTGSVLSDKLTITISSAGAASAALEVFPSGYARPI
jgi:prepilin-type N-terminal cleavage/methylation domain-containing protein